MITKRIDSATVAELWSETTEGHIPCLMEIYNADLNWGDADLEQDNFYLRVINDSNGVMYKGKKYIPCSFSFKAPTEEGTKIGTASITISGLDSRVQQLLEQIELVSDVSVVAMFAKQDNKKYYFRELSHWTFKMETANANRSSATFNLTPDSVFSLNVPRDMMDKNQLNSMVEE